MKKLLVIIIIAEVLYGFKNPIIHNDEEIIPCQEIELGCLILGSKLSGEHVIRNNNDYQKLLEERSPHPDCYSYELPQIDFNKHTLIGYISSVGGCLEPKVVYEIKKNNNNYIVDIIINQYGLCKRNNSIELWCLIPKVNKNSVVKFNITKNFNQTNYENKI